jgi:hypothetical protein
MRALLNGAYLDFGDDFSSILPQLRYRTKLQGFLLLNRIGANPSPPETALSDFLGLYHARTQPADPTCRSNLAVHHETC